ncbi:hypothetical protein JAAARDRAFT_52980 [Jaapia argillacea MUCL 33604]|uniref:Protein kinase domain-containing protein n=1 Tax=Jaapia argillacea MUCL 33604 TaxID=933084 RepID=A0A067QDP7_9AGAM|nr:hypothetical protein JAAARDRAFT_52980 [Jaapia argillacea MUCL 33604]
MAGISPEALSALQSDSQYSLSFISDSTASNLTGVGRTLGLFYSSAGRQLEFGIEKLVRLRQRQRQENLIRQHIRQLQVAYDARLFASGVSLKDDIEVLTAMLEQTKFTKDLVSKLPTSESRPSSTLNDLMKMLPKLPMGSKRQLLRAIRDSEEEINRKLKKIFARDSNENHIYQFTQKDADDVLSIMLQIVDRLCVSIEDMGLSPLIQTNPLAQSNGRSLLNPAHRLTVNLTGSSRVLRSALKAAEESEDTPMLAVEEVNFSDVMIDYCGSRVAVRPTRPYRMSEKTFLQSLLDWKGLDHLFIVPFLGVGTDPSGVVYILSPWMGLGNILDYLREVGPLNADVDYTLLGIALGLEYLHDRQIIHSDLNSGNIFVAGPRHVRIAHFGLSKSNEYVGGDGPLTIGTLQWMAPELLSLRGEPTPSSDIYSFAMVCIEVYTLQIPFPNLPLLHESVIYDVLKGVRPARPLEDPSKPLMSDSLWSLVQWCWAQDPEDRPSAKTLVQALRRCIDLDGKT